MERQGTRKKQIHRSPGYPMISLGEAIEKAIILYQKEGIGYMPREVAAIEHLKYETYGGYPARVIAALKKFNLISERGKDIILTQEAVNLAIYDPLSEDYKEIVRKIALKPDIYKKLYDKYNGILPSNATLKVKLINEYKFNPGKVDIFIKTFRQTLKFAGLLDGDDNIDMENHIDQRIESVKINSKLPTKQPQISPLGAFKSGKSFPVTLKKNNEAILTFSNLPVERSDLELLKKYIDLMSDNWVADENND